MTIACSMSAFSPPKEAACEAIAELGFEYVDLICIGGFGHVIPAELADDFDAAAAEVETMLKNTGLTPIAVNMALAPHLHDRTDPAANARRIEEAEAVARLMQRLGIGLGSFYPGYRAEDRDWKALLADEVVTIRELLAIADRYGVRFVAEPHFATPFETVEQGTCLLEAIPELGVAYDPSHYVMQSIDLRDTTPLLDRAVHVHLRDAASGLMQADLGSGTVDFEWLFGALKERGYKGNFSIEYLAKEGQDHSDNIRKTHELVAAHFGE